MKTPRRHMLAAGLSAAALGALQAAAAWAQAPAFPSRPITLVLPFPAGGATDVIARLVARDLEARVGQPVVVDNKPGGNMMIATNYVLAQRPDGHTLYFMSSTSIEQPALRPATARFNPTVDLTPLTLVGRVKFVLVVNPALPVHNVAQFIQLAKTRPNGISMAVIGQGAADHLAGEMISQQTGANLLTATYRGSAAALVDVASGVVDARITDYASARSFIEAGKVRLIASAELQRVPGSTMETIAETVPGVQVPVWFAMVGPKGMPADVAKTLHGHLVSIVQSAALREKMGELNIEPVTSTPQELREAMRTRVVEVAQIVRERNLKFDN